MGSALMSTTGSPANFACSESCEQTIGHMTKEANMSSIQKPEHYPRVVSEDESMIHEQGIPYSFSLNTPYTLYAWRAEMRTYAMMSTMPV